jgi:hypothetical protein
LTMHYNRELEVLRIGCVCTCIDSGCVRGIAY